MKSVNSVFAFSLLFALCASIQQAAAHPTDESALAYVGVGSSLVVTSDINIPGGANGVAIQENVLRVGRLNYDRERFFCQVWMDRTDQQDRVFSAGRKLKIVGLDWINGFDPHAGRHADYQKTVTFYVDSPSIHLIFCGVYPRGTGQAFPTIGQFRKEMAPFLNIELAQPKEAL